MANLRTRLLKATAVGFILILSALFIAAGVFYSFSINESYIPVITSVIIYSASFFTGITASKGAPDKGYQNGFFAGLIFSGIYILISVFFNGFNIYSLLIKLFVVLIVSTFGGIIGINLKRNKR